MSTKKAILVFGGGPLHLSIIKKCQMQNLHTVVIDPNPFAVGRKYADSFEIVGSDDYDGTCAIIEKYNISGIITTATDKPLVMMARVAERYKFPFFSVQTAKKSTDKFLMKEVFREYGVPFAKGELIEKIPENLHYPIIIKPRDNSGSRGVIYCKDYVEAEKGFEFALSNSKMKNVLVEEFIEGMEYSIETIHQNGKNKIIQFTEKITTNFPYNVELGHIAPAELSDSIKNDLSSIIDKISFAFNFESCASHTEVKIQNNKITVIETSPRLGGDYITSHILPLSREIDIETALINISIGKESLITEKNKYNYIGIYYIDLPMGMIEKKGSLDALKKIKWVKKFDFLLKEGDQIPEIKSSLDRYGFFLLKGKNLNDLKTKKRLFQKKLLNKIHVK